MRERGGRICNPYFPEKKGDHQISKLIRFIPHLVSYGVELKTNLTYEISKRDREKNMSVGA